MPNTNQKLADALNSLVARDALTIEAFNVALIVALVEEEKGNKEPIKHLAKAAKYVLDGWRTENPE